MIGDGFGGGSQLASTMAASGYAITGALLDGLNRHAGWFYLIVAVISLAYAAFWSLAGRGGIRIFFMHVAAVCVASFLLYVPVKTKLVDVAANYEETGINSAEGAAPIPTYIADRIGTSLVDTVKTIVAGEEQVVLPGIEEAMGELMRNGSLLNDRQALANSIIWRQVVAPAMLVKNPDLASALREAGLMDRFLNPATTSPEWISEKMAGDARSVSELLDRHKPNLMQVVCETAPFINEIKARFQSEGWIVADGCQDGTRQGTVSVKNNDSASKSTLDRLGQTGRFVDKGSVVAAGRLFTNGKAFLEGWATKLSILLASDQNRSARELYEHLGNAILYAGVAGTAERADNVKLLGAFCTNKGDSCKRQLAGLYGAVQDKADAEKATDDRGWWEKALNLGASGLMATVLSIVGILVKALSSLIVGLVPYAIGAAKAIAIVLSLVGVYMLLIPGRYARSLEWMIAPLIWVNLWNCFYVVWWKISEILSDLAWTIGLESGEGLGGVNAGLVLHLVSSLGHLALPAIAWQIVFGGAGGILIAAGTAMIEKQIVRAGMAIPGGARRLAGKYASNTTQGSSSPQSTSSKGSATSGIHSNTVSPSTTKPIETAAQTQSHAPLIAKNGKAAT